MFRGLIHIWNEWAIQILVLLSFTMQIFLFVFARTRRHGLFPVLRIFLWLVYLMADSTAVYTLGHLSINASSREHELVLFWAPFLLVHLGSQDTITAYALEDNQLWPRHLLNLGVQAIGVAYILYKHIVEVPTSLGLATGLMFIIGLIKYGERIWALKCATLDSFRDSIKTCGLLPTYYGDLPYRGRRAGERDEEELLLLAQSMLPVCKGGIINFPVTLSTHPCISPSSLKRNWNWKSTFKVVEMELSLMYDILYTKVAVIHRWYGYCIRVSSVLATIIALILFELSGSKDGYSRVDVAITYILVVGAFLLDMASVLSALGSTWTCHLLWTRGWRRLGNVILSLRRHVNAARGHRRWSGSIGQYNLLHFCSRDKTNLSTRVAKMVRLEDWWNTWHYSETLLISEDVKELVFKHVWQLVKKIRQPKEDEDEIQSTLTPYVKAMEDAMATMPSIIGWLGFHPELYDDTARRRNKIDDALNLGGELQEVILNWHLFTNVFLYCSGFTPKDATSLSAYVKAIKALSDYMVFLVAVRPDTVSGMELRSLYEATCDALEKIWICMDKYADSRPSFATREEKLANILQEFGLENEATCGALEKMWNEKYTDPYWRIILTPREEKFANILKEFGLEKPSIIIRRGQFYAKLLLTLVDTGNPDKLGIISHYEKIDHVAMDKLKHLMPYLESSCRDGVFNMPKALTLILDAWVRLLVLASVRSNRDAHAKQISRGGELTTIVWLIDEHASVVFN